MQIPEAEDRRGGVDVWVELGSQGQEGMGRNGRPRQPGEHKQVKTHMVVLSGRSEACLGWTICWTLPDSKVWHSSPGSEAPWAETA